MASPVKTAVQDLQRLRAITRVLTKHGFHAIVHRISSGGQDEDRRLLTTEALETYEGDGTLLGEDRSGAAIRFRKVLEDLGPTFVKLGQVMSTRPDIMPREFQEELKRLQDQVEPLGLDAIHAQVESSLGAPVEELYDWFDDEPIGAASIGQVHRARLHDGTPCVVKVQRPNIAEKIRSDIDILYHLARLLEATIQEVELYSPTGIVREFAQALLAELDFENEAKNLREFISNFQDIEDVQAPRVFDSLTTTEVLTMEFVDAAKLSDIEGGTERASKILDKILDAVVKMVVHDGFYHADPHPGNIMVGEDDSLIFIDFGMVGRLSAAQQDEVINLILAVLTGDVDGIARTLLRMGRPIGRVNLREFKEDVVRIRDSYLLSNLSDINVTQFVQEVMDAAQHHRIQINSAYAVLVKTAMTIEGIMRGLEPDLDIIARATPYVQQLTLRRFSARKIATGALRTSMAFSGFVTQFPEQMNQILMDMENGNLAVNVRNDQLESIGQYLNTLGTRLFLGIVTAGLGICSAILLRDYKLVISDVAIVPTLGVACGVVAMVLFWWALGWHVVGGKERSKFRLTPWMRLFRGS